MPELPENKRTMWLFPDNLVENSDYKFLEFIPKYNTTTSKKIPVFLFWGKLKPREGTKDTKATPAYEGEVITSIWNIYNYDELKKDLPSNTDLWDQMFFKLRKEHDKIVMLPVETVK